MTGFIQRQEVYKVSELFWKDIGEELRVFLQLCLLCTYMKYAKLFLYFSKVQRKR